MTQYADLSAYGTATQSSTFSHSCKPNASKAIDGNSEGVFRWCSVTHTNQDAAAWWEVDLKVSSSVVSVVLFNRVDCCMNRLSNFNVLLKDQLHKVLRSYYEGRGGREIMSFPVRPTRTGVYYVRVQLRRKNYLSLAEVDVYGKGSYHLTNSTCII